MSKWRWSSLRFGERNYKGHVLVDLGNNTVLTAYAVDGSVNGFKTCSNAGGG